MLTRKIRRVGSSLVVTIPSQLAEVYKYDEGTTLEIDVRIDQIIYRKVKKHG